MNFGDCPYPDCDATLMLHTPDKTPKFAIVECDGCRRKLWYKFSRIDPAAWTIENFEAEFIIDHEKKTIVSRNPQPEINFQFPSLEEIAKEMEMNPIVSIEMKDDEACPPDYKLQVVTYRDGKQSVELMWCPPITPNQERIFKSLYKDE